MLVIINLPLIGIWVRLLRVPYRLLFPAILLFCASASTACTTAPSRSARRGLRRVRLCVGKLGCEPAPLALGFVLGPLLEETAAHRDAARARQPDDVRRSARSAPGCCSLRRVARAVLLPKIGGAVISITIILPAERSNGSGMQFSNSRPADIILALFDRQVSPVAPPLSTKTVGRVNIRADQRAPLANSCKLEHVRISASIVGVRIEPISMYRDLITTSVSLIRCNTSKSSSSSTRLCLVASSTRAPKPCPKPFSSWRRCSHAIGGTISNTVQWRDKTGK